MLNPQTTTIARQGGGLPLGEDEAERRWAELDPRQREKLAALEDRVRALDATVQSLQGRRRDLRDQLARTQHELDDVAAARRNGVFLEADRAGTRTRPEPAPALVSRQGRLAAEEAHVLGELATATAALQAARRVAQRCRGFLGLPPERI